MEEESSKVHSEDEKAHSDKNKKRRLKTPSQVEALEKFYNEHKYPLESMKLEIADKIGLTEKQVSGWFCHRRLKYKRLSRDEACENGRLDRSSGVIQDHGSGLGQDSCGSTKPGDYNRHSYPREEEDIPSVNHVYGQNSHYTRNPNAMNDDDDDDDTSSDSNSTLQDVLVSQGRDIKSSRYVIQNGVKNRAPSGYLKLKGNSEHAAIAAVKRQLGRHYRHDGPPLGIEFETLPSGAFEIPIRQPDNESYYVDDPIHPFENAGARKQYVGTTYGTYNSKIDSQEDQFMEHENVRTHHKSVDNHFHHRSTHNSVFPNYYNNPLSNRNSPLNTTSEDSTEKNALYNTNRSIPMRSKHGGDEMRLNSVSKTHFPFSYEKMNNELVEPYFADHKNVKKRELFRSKPASPTTGEESSRRMIKDEKLTLGRSRSREHDIADQARMNPANDMMALSKKVKNEYFQQDL